MKFSISIIRLIFLCIIFFLIFFNCDSTETESETEQITVEDFINDNETDYKTQIKKLVLDNYENIKYLDALAEKYYKNFDYKNALSLYNALKDLHLTLEDEDKVEKYTKKIIDIYTCQNNTKEVFSEFEYLLDLYKETKKGLDYANVNYEIAKYYINLENYDKSIAFLEEAENVYSEIEYTDGRIKSEALMGYVLMLKNEYNKAAPYLKKSLDDSLFNSIENCYAFACTYNAYFEMKIGNPDSASEYLNESIEIAEKLQINDLLITNYEFLSKLQTQIGKDELALASLNKAVDIAVNHNLICKIGSIYNSIGIYYFSKQEYKKAIENFEKSLTVRQKIYDQANEFVVRYNLALCYYRTSKVQKAIQNLKISLKIQKKLGIKRIEEAENLLNEL